MSPRPVGAPQAGGWLLRSCLLAALAVAPARAQLQNKPQDWMTWDGSKVVFARADSAARGLQAESFSRGRFQLAELKAPDGTLRLDYKDQAAWASVRGKSDPNHTVLMRSPDFKSWATHATYRGEHGRAVALYHLDGSRYLLVAGPGGFRQGDRYSPLAVGTINPEGYVGLAHLLDLGLREPLLLPPAKGGVQPGPPEWNRKYASLTLLQLLYPLIRYPGGLALVARRPGYIWLLDDKSGSVKRLIKLYPGVKEERLGPPQHLDWAILGCQPRPNGHLLLASREEDAVLNAQATYPTNKTLQALGDAWQQEQNANQDTANLRRWPRILWWDLNPEDGELQPENPPVNVPGEILDIQIFHAFRFRFQADGNLLVN